MWRETISWSSDLPWRCQLQFLLKCRTTQHSMRLIPKSWYFTLRSFCCSLEMLWLDRRNSDNVDKLTQLHFLPFYSMKQKLNVQSGVLYIHHESRLLTSMNLLWSHQSHLVWASANSSTRSSLSPSPAKPELVSRSGRKIKPKKFLDEEAFDGGPDGGPETNGTIILHFLILIFCFWLCLLFQQLFNFAKDILVKSRRSTIILHGSTSQKTILNKS